MAAHRSEPGPPSGPDLPPPLWPAAASWLSLAEIPGRRTLAFRDPCWPGAGSLRASVARFGILRPVTLFDGGADRGLTVVQGFRRLQAARELGLEQVPARVISDPRLDLAGLFVLAVQSHAGQAFNLRERTRAMAVARDLGLTIERIAEQVLPALGLEPGPELVGLHLRLLALPEELFDLLVAKGLSLRRCLPFCQMPAEEGRLVAQLAAHLGLGSRPLEEVTLALREIAGRDGLPLPALVQELGLLQDRSGALSRLEQRRLPETTARRRELYALCADLAREVGAARVGFDPDFTSDEVTLSLSLSGTEELDLAAAALARPGAARLLARILEKL